MSASADARRVGLASALKWFADGSNGAASTSRSADDEMGVCRLRSSDLFGSCRRPSATPAALGQPALVVRLVRQGQEAVLEFRLY
jgi:hypothetical protein